MTMRLLPALSLLAISLIGGAALAGDRPSAADAGGFLPMETILSKAPGTLIEAELENKRGVWIYEIRTMDSDGKVTKVMVDAKSGDVTEPARDRKARD